MASPQTRSEKPVENGETAASSPSGFAFAGRVLDLQRGELRSHGRPVHLEYRALAVLIYLLHHRSRVIPRQELVDAVWGVRFLSDNALSRAVSLVRSALRDQARPHRFIATCYGRGYRFVGPVRELEPEDLDDGSVVPARPGATPHEVTRRENASVSLKSKSTSL